MFKSIKSFKDINIIYLILIIIIFWIGEINLFSAAGGSIKPWAYNQLIRFLSFLPIFFIVISLKPKKVFDFAGFFLILSIIALIMTLIFGYSGMGAKRWLRLGSFNIQTSEFVKITLILYLSKYFHNLELKDHLRLINSIIPLIITFLIFFLIAIQPDLGTALILLLLGFCMIYLIGIKLIYPIIFFIGLIFSAPLMWNFLKPYQQNRINIFLNPELDPLGKGYHIIQSKIAIGSGGMRGNGFLGGSQSSLDFIPEKETDFVFSIFAEQFGFIGSILLILLFLIFYLIPIFKSFKIKNIFVKMTILGLSIKLILETFINICMTIGIVPVVGVALPFMTYGGSSLLSNMIICALLINFMSSNQKVYYFK